MKKLLALLLGVVMFFAPVSKNEDKKTEGRILSLADAYINGCFGSEDLKSMAFYNSRRELNEDKIEEDFVPAGKTPATLPTETENAIKKDCRLYAELEGRDVYAVDVYGYLGTYNDYVVVTVFVRENNMGYIAVMEEYFVGEYKFWQTAGAQIVVWKRR